MNYSDLKISTTQAEKILLELYKLKGTASNLPGESDFNFKISINNSNCYILKVSRPDEDKESLIFQHKLLEYLTLYKNILAPKVILDINGSGVSEYKDASGNIRKVRLLSWIEGRLWSCINPHSDILRFDLGKKCGNLTKVLQKYDHPKAHRGFDWDIAQSLWTTNHLKLFSKKEKKIVSYFQLLFKAQFNEYQSLRKTVVHNDINDNNIIVSDNILNPTVTAFIDYGDAIYTQSINDLAVACAYAIMHQNDPLEASLALVKGYHASFPLEEEELCHLYSCIAMRLVVSVTKSAINKDKEPNNKYLLISEKPAWEVLSKWMLVCPDFAYYSFRNACGFSAHPDEEKLKKWASNQNFSLVDLFPSIAKNEIELLDLSVSSSWIGNQNDFNNIDFFQFKLDEIQKEYPNKVISGGYLEPRPLYTSTTYDTTGNYGRESRTIHLGIDFWLPNKTAVHALMDGEIMIAVNDVGNKEYGGLVILKHQKDALNFYSLYGHLNPETIEHYKVGNRIGEGDKIGELGDRTVNGNWAPHLHFQLMLSLLDYTNDFPGVAYPNQIDVWKSICPDPNLLFKIKALQTKTNPSNQELIRYRKQHLGKSLSLQYQTPIHVVRGDGAFLLDQQANKYLDTVNNVAHVGHEHPTVVKTAQRQIALLNTNSRYLHENMNLCTKEILDTLPPELSVVHFVNSGSEANELAIRMVKAVTGEHHIIASEMGYHGNSNICVAISSYKFDGKGGKGAPDNTHIFPLPDTFRGKYRGENTGVKYAAEVEKCIREIHKKGVGVGAIIVEPIISCGGQIELPKNFLSEAYKAVRNVGGLCISDEVQVGCGRLGKYFWGFQLHNVIPDIITIGKPLGNGHPLAAVVCTQEVADRFANGMEYFNTFGGNPVSCAIGTAVLQTVHKEKLQENALKVGTYLKEQLKKLAKDFSIIGNVRGQGLFLGIELVDAQKNPLPDQTNYLINRMKEHKILMSADGPDKNVIKIKPPMVFSKENSKELLKYLRKILDEDSMKPTLKNFSQL